jgi:hypothetical protein
MSHLSAAAAPPKLAHPELFHFFVFNPIFDTSEKTEHEKLLFFWWVQASPYTPLSSADNMPAALVNMSLPPAPAAASSVPTPHHCPCPWPYALVVLANRVSTCVGGCSHGNGSGCVACLDRYVFTRERQWLCCMPRYIHTCPPCVRCATTDSYLLLSCARAHTCTHELNLQAAGCVA